MNTLILMMLFLVLFNLLGVFVCHEEVIANVLCFLSGLSFGYFMANKKNRCLTKQLSDDLIFFVQSYNNKSNVDIRIKYVPVYTPPKGRDFFSYLDELKYEETIKNTDNYFQNVKVVNFDLIHHFFLQEIL